MPRAVRRQVAELYAGAPGAQWKAAVAPMLVGTVWLVPLVAVGAVLWILCSRVFADWLASVWRVSIWKRYTRFAVLDRCGLTRGVTPSQGRESMSLRASVPLGLLRHMTL